MAVTKESVAVEDYLEKILELIDSKGYARVADLAEALGIAQPSVSNMMRRLDEKGLLCYEKYRGVTLTASGEKLAMYEREKKLDGQTFDDYAMPRFEAETLG